MKQDSKKPIKKEWIKDVSYVRTERITFEYIEMDEWVVDVKYHVFDLNGNIIMVFIN